MTINEFVKNAFEIRNQAHLWHWMTRLDPEHRALGEFYDSWLELTDTFIETFAGKYQRPDLGFACQALPYTVGDSLNYMQKVAVFMQSTEVRSIAPDSDLQNILDEMTSLANHTAYRLTLL